MAKVRVFALLVGALSLVACASKSYRYGSRGRYKRSVRASYGGGSAKASSRSYRRRHPAPKTTPSDSAPGRSVAYRAPGGRGGASTPPRTSPRGTPRNPVGIARKPNPARRGRMIIYNGNLSLFVLNVREAIEAARRIARATGGWLSRLSGRQLTFRVPVLRFHELMDKLAGIGDVRSRHISASDITQRYHDLESRLRAAEAVLSRLRQLLLKAKNVKESLMIEREMARLLEKVERFKGTLRYLRKHAAFSTVTIMFYPRGRHRRIRPSRSPFGWVKNLGLWRMFRRY